MPSPEKVAEFRIELNHKYFGRSKEESTALPLLTSVNNVFWYSRGGLPGFYVHGLNEEERQNDFVDDIKKWLIAEPEFNRVHIEFYSNKEESNSGAVKYPELLRKIRVEESNPRANQ